MKKILFLDIEGTILEEVTRPKILWGNVKEIKRLIRIENPDEVRTFSFGLQEELEFFTWNAVKPELEHHLGCEIQTQTFDLETVKLNFLSSIFGHASKKDIWGFLPLCKKEPMFRFFIEKNFDNAEVWLIDDLVPNADLTLLDQSLIFHFRNINKL
jgi:hypothetical protein